MTRIPPTRAPADNGAAAAVETVEIPRPLAEATVALLLQVPAGQVFRLIEMWDQAVPGLIVRQPQD